MARYKDYNPYQDKMLPVNFSEQILPGTFEYTLQYLIENEIDLTVFEAWYCNDEGGSPAYDPAILLKIIFLAYSRGITSSRKIERLCRENIVFMALSSDSQPHFTTIANFISRMNEVIKPLFTQLLMTCDEAGLIGHEMFAIDGCKLPSNASKEWSGTHKELTKKHQKIDRAVRRMMAKHRNEDEPKQESSHIQRTKEEQQIKTLRSASKKIKQFCKSSTERVGVKGKPVKSNITDNESAKMKTSHGVLQGYNGVAAVDDQNQIVIAAEAYGQGPENNLLKPLVEQTQDNLGVQYIEQAKLTVDAGFHSRDNLNYCKEKSIDAYIADGNFRKRDPRFKEYERFKPKEKLKKHFSPEDFDFREESNTCYCPANKKMWKIGGRVIGGFNYVNFQGYLRECRTCPLQSKCMRKPPKESGRQVSIRAGQVKSKSPDLIVQMKEKIDSNRGRHIYSRRLGTVEPVFGNINTNKRLSRFSLRGKKKVNAQWLMYCMVHNIEKLQKYGQLEGIRS